MEDSVASDTLISLPVEEENVSNNEPAKSKDPFIGSYYCSRSGDTYIFNEDKTGTFIPNGGSGATYKWRLKGHSLIVTYMANLRFSDLQNLDTIKRPIHL